MIMVEQSQMTGNWQGQTICMKQTLQVNSIGP